jgi:hypothetical protein
MLKRLPSSRPCEAHPVAVKRKAQMRRAAAPRSANQITTKMKNRCSLKMVKNISFRKSGDEEIRQGVSFLLVSSKPNRVFFSAGRWFDFLNLLA